MKYTIQDYNEIWMPVYYNVEQEGDSLDIMAFVYSSVHSTEKTIAEISMIQTSFKSFIIQIHKMECEIKTAERIIDFFMVEQNFKP